MSDEGAVARPGEEPRIDQRAEDMVSGIARSDFTDDAGRLTLAESRKVGG